MKPEKGKQRQLPLLRILCDRMCVFALGYRKFWGAIRMLLHSTITILMRGKGIPAAVENNMNYVGLFISVHK
jgi:hypothetical protein